MHIDFVIDALKHPEQLMPMLTDSIFQLLFIYLYIFNIFLYIIFHIFCVFHCLFVMHADIVLQFVYFTCDISDIITDSIDTIIVRLKLCRLDCLYEFYEFIFYFLVPERKYF